MGSVIWIYSAVTAGIVESIFFIGLPWLLYRHVRAAPSRIAFALLATTVFAVAHWEQGPHVIIGAFFSNLVACFWYFLLGTLWPVAAGHILVDLVAFA
nr:CPBP family intramembrane glutamic endopeptidase [Pseudoduganella rivuli]